MANYQFWGMKINNVFIPCSDANVDPAIEAMVEAGTGSFDPTMVSMAGIAPVITGTTFDLAAINTALSLDGVALANTTILYFAKRAIGSTYAGTIEVPGVHTSVTINKGLGVIDSITGGIDQAGKATPASAKFTLHAIHDGTNYPITIAANVELPTLTALTSMYRVHSAVLSYGESSTLELPVHQIDYNSGLSIDKKGTASRSDPVYAAIMEWKPTAKLATHAVATALGVCGIDGLALTGAVLYFAKCGDGPTSYAAGGVHFSLTFTTSLLVPDRVSADNGGNANADYTLYGVYDGSNEIVVASATASLSTIDLLAEAFTVGKGTIAAGTLELQSLSLNCNISVEHATHSGYHRATSAEILSRKPDITCDSNDVGNVAAIGEAETSCVFYFRKIDNLTVLTRVADATEEHISLTCPKAYCHVTSMGGGYGAYSRQGLRVVPIKDGANDVVEISTAAAMETE